MALFNNPWQQLVATPSPLGGLTQGIESGFEMAQKYKTDELNRQLIGQEALRKSDTYYDEQERLRKLSEVDLNSPDWMQKMVEADPSMALEVARMKIQYDLSQNFKPKAEWVASLTDPNQLELVYTSMGQDGKPIVERTGQLKANTQLISTDLRKKQIEQDVNKLEAIKTQNEFNNRFKLNQFNWNKDARAKELAFKYWSTKFNDEKRQRDYNFDQNVLNQRLGEALKQKKGVPIDAKALDEAHDIVSIGAPLVKGMTELQSLIDKYGYEKAPTLIKAKMGALLHNIQGDLKSENFVNLGVLTGNDYEFLLEMTGDPTKLDLLYGGKKASTKLKETLNYSLGKVNTKLSQKGFEPLSVDEWKNLVPNVDMTPENDVTKEIWNEE